MLTSAMTTLLLVMGIFGQAAGPGKPQDVAVEKPVAIPAWTLKEAIESKSSARNNTQPLQILNRVNVPVLVAPKLPCSIPLTRVEPRDKNSKIQNIAPDQVDPQNVIRPPAATCDEKATLNPDLIEEIPLILPSHTEQKIIRR
jgi:hypothetical protein